MGEIRQLSARTPFVGPIFFWELIRQTRKGRGYPARLAYAALTLGMLFLVLGDGEITQKNAAYLSERTVFLYLALQYAAVLVLTPIFVAGAFIEDRQQNTLQLLLTTFLSPREIVLGKLCGRLVHVGGTLVAGLPVLALLQLLGGVDLLVLLMHSALALSMMVICGMYAIRASTLCKTVGGAILMTYTILAGSCLLSILVAIPCGMFMMGENVGGIRLILWGPIILINALCGFLALYNAVQSIHRRERDANYGSTKFPGGYAELDLSKRVQIVDLPVPANRITKPDTSELGAGPATQRIHRAIRWKRLPAAWDWPIVWKETYFPVSDVDTLIASFCCWLPLTIFLASFVSHQSFVAVQPFIVWCCQVMMLFVLALTTLRGCGVFAQERLQQTLTSLLCTPWSTASVVFQAWLGTMWRFGACLIGTLMLGLSLIVYQPLAGVMIVLAFLSQLACFTVAGLLLSTSPLTPFQTRCLVGTYFFGGLVLPAFIGNWLVAVPFCLTLLVHPFLAISLIWRQFEWDGTLESEHSRISELGQSEPSLPWRLTEFTVLEGVLVLAALTAIILAITRRRLKKLAES